MPTGYEVDYPLVPPLDKNTLTALCILVMLYLKKQKNPVFKPGLWNKFFLGYIAAIIISTLINSDPLDKGGVYIPASKPYDAISNLIFFFLTFLPFIFGRNFLTSLKGTEEIFKKLTIFALIYTIPMVWEIRFSPQLHIQVFGYFPGDFLQQMRSGGFRPVVFIGHGLALAFWYSTCAIAALALYKTKVKATMFFGFKVLIFFTIVLVFCKTVSAVIYLALAAILILFLKPKVQIYIALVFAILVMIYPMNAVSQFVKNSDVLEYVSEYSIERSQSLETRFDNEHILMEKALERPWFGWSGWGRNRVYAYGKDITITDGKWVMEFGVYGTVGFVFYYLMLIYPLFLALKQHKYIRDKKLQIHFVALAIILAIGIVDSVPNTGMMPIHLLLAGALLGQAERIKAKQKQQLKEEIDAQ